MNRRPSNPKNHRKTKAANSTSSANRNQQVLGRPRPQRVAANHRIIPGQHSIRAALEAHRTSHHELWLSSRWESDPKLRELQNLAQGQGVPIRFKGDHEISVLHEGHQGAILISEKIVQIAWSDINYGEKAAVLFLDHLEDPHNFGAILRTAWLLGVDAVFYPEDRSVDLTPAVHKVACGGVEYLNLIRLPNFANLVADLKAKNFWFYGLSHKGQQTVLQTKFPSRTALFVGAEEKGLRGTSEKLCDELISIPQADANASFNASVATAMVLFESFRQRQ